MLSKSLGSLVRRSGTPGQLLLASCIGCLLGFTYPIVCLLLGEMVQIAIQTQAADSAAEANTIKFFPVSVAEVMPQGPAPFAKITALLAMACAVTLLASVLLYFFYRLIQQAAVEFEVRLFSHLREHARQLAVARTVSSQKTALTDCLDYHLPRVRGSLTRWWRTSPRHIVQLAACLIIALIISPILSLLTLTAIGLVIAIYLQLDRIRRTALPVVRERATQERGALVSFALNGPLLESVHPVENLEARFKEQLAKYRRDAVGSLTSSAWKIPLFLLAGGLLGASVLFVATLKVFQAEGVLSPAGLFTLTLVISGAAMSAWRLQRGRRELSSVESASVSLEQFLSLPILESATTATKTIKKVTKEAELDHVTLEDSSGQKLLDNISIKFATNQLIGIVAGHKLQANALAELLIGYGRPSSGRMLVDGISINDLQPKNLVGCSHWVSSDGALSTGTLLENLGASFRSGDEAMSELATKMRLTKLLQQLNDGANTLITPGDDRLGGDDAFRIGLGRAAVRKPSVLVIEEPISRYDAQTEEDTMLAIRELVDKETITIVLPQRLQTLRKCDVIFLLHEHRLSGSGTHGELLQSNEFYRHVNYLRFNPFKSV